jgi:Flp pilus assembly protein TadD
MKQVKSTFILTLALVATLLASCGGLEKMAAVPSPVSWSVKPQILEMQAGRVPVQITVNFPAKYFDKKAVIVTRPIIKWDGGQKELVPFTLQGESVTDNNPIIKNETGGSFTYNDTVDFVDGMRMSTLEAFVKASAGDKSVDIPVGKIANGVLATSLLVKEGLLVDNGGTVLGKTIKQDVTLGTSSLKSYNANFNYALQQADIRPAELKDADVVELLKTLAAAKNDSSLALRAVSISSYASPDGPLALNTSLSGNRGTNATKFMEGKFKSLKYDDYTKLINSQTTAEDWDGFKTELGKSNVRDKALIERVLSMYSDPEVREKEIKNISEAYTDLKVDVLPQLRRSKVNVQFETKALTPEQVYAAALSNPSSLSQSELFYAGSYAQNANDRISAMKAYTTNYPNDWKGFSNLGNEYLTAGQLNEAKTAYEKADELNKDNGAILNNLGVLALTQGDENAAYDYFTKAVAAGENSPELNYNLGVLNIKKAKYDKAVANFGATYSYNSSLAQLLAGNANGAMTTINEVEKEHKDASVYYLKAVIAARNNDVEMVINSLRTAISKDGKWKDYAIKDMEFFKYLENVAFKAILQ